MSEEFSRRDFLKKSAVVLGIGVIPALNEIQASPSILRVKTSGETLTQMHGYITDEQMNAVPNALVNVCGQKTTTDKQGQFCLSCSLPSKFGYRRLVEFKVSARGYHNLDLYLAPSGNGELTIYNCPIVEDRVFKGDGEFNISLRRKIQFQIPEQKISLPSTQHCEQLNVNYNKIEEFPSELYQIPIKTTRTWLRKLELRTKQKIKTHWPEIDFV